MPPKSLFPLVACLALLTGGCNQDRQETGSETATMSAADATLPELDEECPHDWSWTPRQRENIEAFTGGRDDILAFNDCQRFLVGSRANPTYGGIFAIFIGEDAATAADVPGEDAMTPVALVAAYDAYEPLGIDDPGFYCILTDGRSGPHARMAPAGPDADCREPMESEGASLFVVRRGGPSGAPLGAADVPGVARWGFDGVPGHGTEPDADGWVQYAILPCGDAVCYVGPAGPQGSGAGFAPKSPRAVLGSISPQLPAGGTVRRVDGWNDIQFLANPELVDGGTRPHPGLPVGVILPDDSLALRSAEDFDAGWVRVAEVAISASSAYEDKLNFASSRGGRYNTVDLCSYPGGTGGAGNCDGLPPDLAERCEATDPEDREARRWRRRHVNAETGAARYYCVKFTPHARADEKLDIPGVARWKWLTEDEETWYRCAGGCCAGAG